MSDDGALRQPPVFRNGSDSFRIHGASAGFTLGDYWRWAASDLVINIQRGVLAEFIVTKALGAAEDYPRNAWDIFDVAARNTQTGESYDLEVKSAAYVQAWHQINSKPSPISFNIAPSEELSKRFGKPTRPAWAYVFCVLGKPGADPDPLDLGQWEFYVITTAALDEERPSQKTIRLNPLRELVKSCEQARYADDYRKLWEVVDDLHCKFPEEGDEFPSPG